VSPGSRFRTLTTISPASPGIFISSMIVKMECERDDSRFSWCSPITRFVSPWAHARVHDAEQHNTRQDRASAAWAHGVQAAG
jgi:hypothetical protein